MSMKYPRPEIRPRRGLVAAAALTLLPLLAAGDARAQLTEDVEEEAAAPVLPAPEDVLMLRLRDGGIRWGSIESHDTDGILFFLISSGGRVSVPWSLVDPTQELELRMRFGYVDVASEEIFVEAERLVLKGGGEIVGVIREPRTGPNFEVQVDGNLQVIPKTRVAAVQSGLRVPALEVYSREEFYRRLSTGVDPEDADALVALARDCERILDFIHAVQHYEEALVLDATHDDGATAARLETARVKSDQQEQIEYLREVDRLRRKGYYDEALVAIEDFAATFPNSKLLEDASKKKVTVLEARDEAIGEEVVRQWHRSVERFAREAARDSTFEQAQLYAGEQLGIDVLARVTELVQNKISEDIQPENVREYWDNRDKRVRYQLASFGSGTWLLGEESAKRGLEEEPQLEALGQLDEQRQSLKRKIETYLKSRQQAMRSRSRADDAENFELFWSSWSPSSRSQWIRAYYVEYGGDMEVRPKPRFSNCSECGGTGAREVVYIGGGGGEGGNPGSQLVACPSCKGVQVIRRIYYR